MTQDDILKPDYARNMRIIGHSDQGGRSDGVQVMSAVATPMLVTFSPAVFQSFQYIVTGGKLQQAIEIA